MAEIRGWSFAACSCAYIRLLFFFFTYTSKTCATTRRYVLRRSPWHWAQKPYEWRNGILTLVRVVAMGGIMLHIYRQRSVVKLYTWNTIFIYTCKVASSLVKPDSRSWHEYIGICWNHHIGSGCDRRKDRGAPFVNRRSAHIYKRV